MVKNPSREKCGFEGGPLDANGVPAALRVAKDTRSARGEYTAERNPAPVFRVQQTEMQPEFVLVRIFHGERGRQSEQREPALDWRGQLPDSFPSGRVHSATKPFAGQAECDPLHDTAGPQTGFTPSGPERIVASRSFEEVCDLVNVPETQISDRGDVARVQGGVRQTVHRIERGNSSPSTSDIVRRQNCADFSHIESHFRIPEAEVQFEGWRHFGIVVVAAPGPTGLADHYGKMVGPGIGTSLRASYPRPMRFRARRASIPRGCIYRCRTEGAARDRRCTKAIATGLSSRRYRIPLEAESFAISVRGPAAFRAARRCRQDCGRFARGPIRAVNPGNARPARESVAHDPSHRAARARLSRESLRDRASSDVETQGLQHGEEVSSVNHSSHLAFDERAEHVFGAVEIAISQFDDRQPQKFRQGAVLFRTDSFVAIAIRGLQTARGFTRARMARCAAARIPPGGSGKQRELGVALERDRHAQGAGFDFNIELAVGAALRHELIQLGKEAAGRFAETDSERAAHHRAIGAAAHECGSHRRIDMSSPCGHRRRREMFFPRRNRRRARPRGHSARRTKHEPG